MKAAAFEYVRAADLTEAVQALAAAAAEDREAKVLAGGQSLTPMLALRLARPELLVDINRVPGLAELTPIDGGVRLGALVRHATLATQTRHPLLAEAARWIGHPAIRTRGTTGGSLAHADPAAELPVVATALAAVVHVTGPAGTRQLGVADLFDGLLSTTLAEDELITAVDVPLPRRWGFAELSRRHGDFGLVTVVAAEVAGEWRLAVGGVGGVPFRATGAEALLTGSVLSAGTAESAAALVAAAVDPPSDVHAPAGYRRAMAGELTRRALTAALHRPGAA